MLLGAILLVAKPVMSRVNFAGIHCEVIKTIIEMHSAGQVVNDF